MADINWMIPILISFIFIFLVRKLVMKGNTNHNNKKLPPSPPGLPVIGHLHLLRDPLLHRSLHELNEKYGPILYLRFGYRKVLVVSSPSAVEEIFTKNDIIFANRPRTLAGKHLGYNNTTIGFSSYNNHWRNLRRLTSLELFSTARITMCTNIREEEVQLLVKRIFQESSAQACKIEPKPRFRELAFNNMLRMLTGKRFYGDDLVSQEGKEFQALMKEFAELGATFLSDFFPILQWFDYQGVEKRMVKLMNKMDGFVQNLIDDHRRRRSKGEIFSNQERSTLVETMLSLRENEPEFYTDQNIRGVILAMLVAGSETSATTLEWALSLLLNHPDVMTKVKDEIEKNVGQDRLINESDISKLSYLQNVITETLRLYPVLPFLLPHENSSECTVGGYDIPGGTMLLVNLWTMQRDPKVWKEPTKFMPERFEGLESGERYNMIPFGVGRRSCTGAGLAKRVMALALGALIQSFDWERIGNQEISTVEGIGLTMPKVDRLVALCRPRPVMTKVLSDL